MNESLAGEVLLFTSVADFESRANFHAALTLAAGELDRIVAKYELPANRAGWTTCGLNGCNTEHRFGYLIRAKDGRETNIGHECGKREFGVSFEEVEATFRRAQDLQARQRAIQALLEEKPALQARAAAVVTDGEVQASRLTAFVGTFKGLHGFWKELLKAAKQGGVVRAAVKRDSEWTLGGGKEQLTTVARFSGSSVLVSDASSTPNLVRKLVLPWLETLVQQELDALDEAALGSVVRKGADMRNLLMRTEAFVKESGALLTSDNIAGLEPICDHVLRPSDAGIARPVLHAWVAKTQLSGPPTAAVRIHRQSWL